jgi:hypothetical protein
MRDSNKVLGLVERAIRKNPFRMAKWVAGTGGVAFGYGDREYRLDVDGDDVIVTHVREHGWTRGCRLVVGKVSELPPEADAATSHSVLLRWAKRAEPPSLPACVPAPPFRRWW